MTRTQWGDVVHTRDRRHCFGMIRIFS